MMTPWDNFCNDHKNKRVLIFGLGLLGGGESAASLYVEAGADVRVTDAKTASELSSTLKRLDSLPIEYVLGSHRREDIEWADIIVRNPSVPWHHELLHYARQLGKDIVMDAQVFMTYAPHVKTIGITGTRGKTTTTSLIAEILKAHYQGDVVLGGNLALQPMLPYVKKVPTLKNPLALMELSSWQLQAFHSHHLSVNVALLTNLYPDHLNYYPDLPSYYDDKKAIFTYQRRGDSVCFNRDQPEFHEWARSVNSKVIWYSTNDLPDNFHLMLPGEHNRQNAAAAVTLTSLLGIPKTKSLPVVAGFRGVPYRLETVRHYRGITIINDTTSTTPVATLAALASVTLPAVVIVGGTGANLPLDTLAQKLNQPGIRLILLSGTGTNTLKPLLLPSQILLETTALEDAVHTALQSPGIKTLLFSPAFKSFGLFHNEFHRGEIFNDIIKRL